MINHGAISAYLDEDAATIRNNVAVSSSISNFGSLNTAWKNLNRNLYLSGSVSKYFSTNASGYQYINALSESIAAYNKIPAANTQITTSTGTGGGGAGSRPITCADGTVYIPPYGAVNAGWVYNPTTNTIVTASGATSPSANQYIGGVLMRNGKVFTIPFAVTASRIYDPATVSCTYASPQFPTGFGGGVLLPNGNVFLNPVNATRAIVYNPDTNVTASSAGVAYSGSGAAYGCVLTPSGKVVSVPYAATKIFVYDIATNSASVSTSTMPGTSAFFGGVLLPNGRIFFIPYGSTSARIYDADTDTVTTPTPTFPGSNAYLGGTLLPSGKVLLIPANQTKPGFYDYINDTYTTGSTAWHATTFAFYGGCMMLDGRIFCAGYNALRHEIYTDILVSQQATLALSPFQNKGV
jgi:hypothetical protein